MRDKLEPKDELVKCIELKEAAKEKLISDDDERRGEELVQKLTDQYVKLIDESLANKEKEITQV